MNPMQAPNVGVGGKDHGYREDNKMSEHQHQKRYGAWAGNNKGVPADKSRCAEEVADGYFFYQCSRKCGHGPNGIYCKQHAKRFKAEES